jgi:hypothetical protein
LAWLTVQIWASTKSKNRMPSLDRYLVQADATPATPEGKARQHLAALRVLSAQFGIPLRQGDQTVS